MLKVSPTHIISQLRSQLIRCFSSSSTLNSDFSHVVIGGGIVGTAIASEIQSVEGNNVLLIEQHESLAMETTSRNSEVIHAGLYYPKNSLKGQLCIRGKNMIYEAWKSGKFHVPLNKCGKWIVAQDKSEQEYLEKLYNNAQDVGVPVNFVSTTEAKAKFPLIRAECGILESPSTGIISAHDFVLFFQSKFENDEGTIGLNTRLVNIDYNKGSSNYHLTLKERDSFDDFTVTTDNLINAAGLHAQKISNCLLPKERHYKSFFAKGTYFSYQPEKPISAEQISNKLIYPCPNPNATSLGTHLTFDLGGQLRFGPDLEWLDVEDADDLDYSVSEKNIPAAYEAIRRYFPSIKLEDLQPSYSGIRPKISSEVDNKKQYADFIIREEEGFPGFVNLIGIESPGLTSAWAIGEYVRDIYHK